MASEFELRRIATLLGRAAVIAYPTEGVYGFGCLPTFPAAVERILELKQRRADAGLILLAADGGQLRGWTTLDDPEALSAHPPERPVTWIVPAGPRAYPTLTGGRQTLAVRISSHPVCVRLAELAGEPLISTSANRHGQAPLTSVLKLRREFGPRLDAIAPGQLGAARGPSEIRDRETGTVLRPGGWN